MYGNRLIYIIGVIVIVLVLVGILTGHGVHVGYVNDLVSTWSTKVASTWSTRFAV